MPKRLSKELIVVGIIFACFSGLIAIFGLLFYQGLAAFDDNLSVNNDLVFFVPKDKQKEDILDAIKNLELDLQNVDVIEEEDLVQLQSLEDLLDLNDEFKELDALLEQ